MHKFAAPEETRVAIDVFLIILNGDLKLLIRGSMLQAVCAMKEGIFEACAVDSCKLGGEIFVNSLG